MASYNINEYAPQSGNMLNSSGAVKNLADAIDGSGSTAKLKVDIGSANVSLNTSDIQIGAVEIKSGSSTSPADAYRMAVNSDGSIPIRIVGSIDGGPFIT